MYSTSCLLFVQPYPVMFTVCTAYLGCCLYSLILFLLSVQPIIAEQNPCISLKLTIILVSKIVYSMELPIPGRRAFNISCQVRKMLTCWDLSSAANSTAAGRRLLGYDDSEKNIPGLKRKFTFFIYAEIENFPENIRGNFCEKSKSSIFFKI